MKKMFIFAFAFILISAGCACQKAAPTEEKAADKSPELYEEYKDLAGNWQGQWKNTTFGSSGAAKTTVEINTDGTASFTIDLDGLVFGMVNPDPKTFTSNYTEKDIVFTQKDDLFGDVTITITKTGDETANIDVKAENVPAPSIGSMTASGSLTREKLHLDYTVFFSPSGSAKGVMDMTKVE